MKIRTDFVTNSSSSSFILGKPNMNTVTTDDAKKFLINSAKELIDIFDKLDELLYSKSNIGTILKIVRNNDNTMIMCYGEETKAKSYIKDYIEKTFSMKKEIKRLFKSKGINITDNYYYLQHNEIDWFLFFWSYFDSYDIDFIRDISLGNIPDFVKILDFRENESDFLQIGETVYWYLSLADEYGIKIPKNVIYKLNDYDDSKLAELGYDYLGEVALYRDDGERLPLLLEDYMRAKSNYGCTHMG